MPQADVQQNEQQTWEQDVQPREQHHHSQQPPPPSQPETDEHASLHELSDVRSRFAKLSADFAVPEILEYKLQPARSMSNGLALIARLATSFLSYRSFTSSQSTKYSGPRLAFSAPNKPVRAYSESLVQMLGALDAVESGRDARVRDAGKALGGNVEG